MEKAVKNEGNARTTGGGNCLGRCRRPSFAAGPRAYERSGPRQRGKRISPNAKGEPAKLLGTAGSCGGTAENNLVGGAGEIDLLDLRIDGQVGGGRILLVTLFDCCGDFDRLL